MGIFGRRTTKTIGKDIGASIRRQEMKRKNLRTLQREAEEREKERKLNRQIAELKAKRPSAFKSFVKGARATGKVALTSGRIIGKAVAQKPAKRSKRRQKEFSPFGI